MSDKVYAAIIREETDNCREEIQKLSQDDSHSGSRYITLVSNTKETILDRLRDVAVEDDHQEIEELHNQYAGEAFADLFSSFETNSFIEKYEVLDCIEECFTEYQRAWFTQ